jgi:glycine/D-amino acid oxidase-like deaminating enzyme
MKTIPYWWEQAPREAACSVEMPARVDVAIIGAGYSGLNTAFILARQGLSVAVFEAGQLGEGASSRNGGMVGPSFHKLGIAGLRAQYGEAKTNEILSESVGFVDFLESFLEQQNIDADFKRVGRFRGALKPAHFEAMARELESLQLTCGVSGALVNISDLSSETGSQRFFGGVVYHQDAGLHPAKYHNALATRVRQLGATVLTHTAVKEITSSAGGYRMTTTRGKLLAQRVAICTNGYTGPQFPDLRRRVLPLRSAIIATEKIDPALMSQLMPNARMCGDSRRIVAYYRPSPDGERILFGSRATGIHDNPVKNTVHLRRSLVEIFPQLADTRISHCWSGLVAYTFDHVPHIGQRDGIFYAMGYCGSGVARASYFGQKLAYKILDQQDQGRTAFDDLTFQGKPLYTGNPWFMPMLLNWHRLADRLGF